MELKEKIDKHIQKAEERDKEIKMQIQTLEGMICIQLKYTDNNDSNTNTDLKQQVAKPHPDDRRQAKGHCKSCTGPRKSCETAESMHGGEQRRPECDKD